MEVGNTAVKTSSPPRTEESNANHNRASVSFFSSIFVKLILAFFIVGVFPFGAIVYLYRTGYEAVFERIAEEAPGLLQTSPLAEMLAGFELHAGIVVVFLFGIIGTASVGVSYIIARPARKLLSVLQEARQSNFMVVRTLDAEGADEIGAVTRELNATIERFRSVRERDRSLSRAKDEFLAITAHQLRTPLTVIKWTLQGFLTGGIREEKKLEVIKTTYQTTERMIHLIGNLLDVVRIEEGRFGYQFEETDVAGLVNQVIHDFDTLVKARSITLDVLLPPTPLPPAMIDVDGITIVMTNILENAFSYTPPGGTVTITVRMDHEKERVEIGVQDTGIGIPASEAHRIFDKFFRAPNAQHLQPDGSGLGLFIAKRILERHGSTIEVESQEGKGSLFIFSLPLHEKDIPPEEAVFKGFFEGIGASPAPSFVDGGKAPAA